MAYYSTGGGMTSTGSQRGPYASPPWMKQGGAYTPPSESTPKTGTPNGNAQVSGTVNQRGDTMPVWNQGVGRTAGGAPINSFMGGAQPSAQPQAQAYQQPTQQAQPMNPSMMLGAQPYAAAQPMYGASQGYMNQTAPASTGGAYVGGMGGGYNNPSNYEYNAATDPGTAYQRTAGYAKNQADQQQFAQQQASYNDPMAFQQHLQQTENARVAAEQPQLAANNAAADAASRAQYAAQLQTVNPEFAGQSSGLTGSLASIYKPSLGQQMQANPTAIQQATRNRGTGIVGGYQKPTSYQSSPLLSGLMGQ